MTTYNLDNETLHLSNGQGETLIINLTYKAQGVPVNLTGRTAQMVFITNGNKRSTYPGTVNSEGLIRIKVSNEDTAKWPIGKHSYRVELHSNGDVKWPLSGKLMVGTYHGA